MNELVLQLRAETQVLKRDADKAAREARLVLFSPLLSLPSLLCSPLLLVSRHVQ